jgi:TP901 family phage tail tape measure protein
MADAPVRVTINVTDKATPALNKFVLQAVRNFKNLETGSEKLGASLGRTARTADTLSGSFDRMEREAKQAAGGLRSTGVAAGAAQKGMNGVTAASGAATKSVTSQQRSITSLIGTAAQVLPVYTAVGAALNTIQAGFRFAGESIVGFDKALIETAAISKDVRENFADVRNAIIDLRPELGSTTEIAQGLFETMQAGISTGQSLEDNLNFTAQAALLSKAAFSDVTTSVNVLSASMSAYGANIDRAQEFSDVLFQTVELGQIRLSELNTTLGRVLPVSAALGVSFKDVGATLATLTQGGFTTAQAGTALRTVFANVIQEADAFAEAGINVNEVLGEKGILGLMEAIQGATGGAAGAVRKFIPNIRGTVAALGLVNNQLGALGTNLKEFEGELGQAARAAAIAKTSISESFATMTASLDRLIQRATGEKGAAIIAKLFRDIGKEIDSTSKEAAKAGGGFEKFNNAIARLRVGGDAIAITFQKLRLASAEAGLSQAKLTDKFGITTGATKRQEQKINDLKASIIALNEVQAEELAKITSLGDAIGKTTAVRKEAVKVLSDMEKIQGRITNTMNLVLASTGGLKTSQQLLNEQWKRTGTVIEEVNKALDEQREAAITTGKGLSNMDDEITKILNGSVVLEKEVNKITNAFALNADKTKATQQEYKQLAESFATGLLKSRDLLNTLNSLGVSQDNLTGKSRTLSAEVVVAADKMGFQSEEVFGLIDDYNQWALETDNVAGKLQKLGVDVGNLTNKISAQAAIAEKLNDPLKKVATALELITGVNNDKMKELNNRFQALKIAFESGALSANVLKIEMAKLTAEATQFGKEAPEEYKKLTAELEIAARATLTVADAFQQVNNVKIDVARQQTEDLARNMVKLGQAGLATKTQLLDTIESVEASARQQWGGSVPIIIQQLIDQMKGLAASANTTAETFKEAGVKTAKELSKTALETQKNFMIMFQSGLATGQSLVDFYKNSVEPAFEEAGIRIPQSLVNAFRRSEVQAEVELAKSGRRMGTATGTGLITGFEEVVTNQLGQVINTIENRFRESLRNVSDIFDQIAPGTTQPIPGVTFATDRAGLEQNLADLKRLMAGIRGATDSARSSREQLNKAIQIVMERLAALNKAEQEAAREAERLAEATNDSFSSISSSIDSATNSADRFSQSARSLTDEAANAAFDLADAYDEVSTSVNTLANSTGSLVVGTGDFNIPSSFDQQIEQQRQEVSGAAEGQFSGQIGGTGSQINFNAFSQNIEGAIASGFSGVQINVGGGEGSLVTGGSFTASAQSTSGPQTGNIFLSSARFQTGTQFAQQGQIARLEAGEAILTSRERAMFFAAQAASLRGETGGFAPSSTSRQVGGFGPQTSPFMRAGGRTSAVHFPSRAGGMVVPSGFSFVPGLGFVPRLQLAAATGRLQDVAGPTNHIAQQQIQETVIPLVRGSITRRDLTRDIQGATSLTNKGEPSTGGS